MRFFVKILISALVIAGVSELGRRSSWIAAILASLPLTSILALSWLYFDTRDESKVASLSWSILWAVLPSLLFFAVLPGCLKLGLRFPASMALSCAVMAIAYAAYAWALRLAGVGL